MFSRNKSDMPLPGNSGGHNENQILRDLAAEYARELKWRRIFKFTLLALIVWYFVAMFRVAGAGATAVTEPHTALVDLNGPIGLDIGVNADQISDSLRRAFNAKMAKGVVLRIDSPGGTPVQSAEINAEIVRLRAQHPDKPIYAVIGELCASGAYYVAVASDQIFANPASIVGSIGVRLDSFGVVDAMQKLGIERRTLTAGENKALLDPFAPQNESAVAHLQLMLNDVHDQFIDAVKQGRGDRLQPSPEIFSGLVWSGTQAKQIGLIDDFGSLDSVARDVIGAEKVVDYSYKAGFFEQLSRDFGVSVGQGIAQSLGFDLRLN